MRRRPRILAVAAAVAVLIAPGPALADTALVDQRVDGVDAFISGDYLFAQTFTAGIYGNLQSVDLYLGGNSASVTVSIQGTTGNPPVPDGTILGSKTVGVNHPPEWVNLVFAANPVVLPGRAYAIFIFPTSHASVYATTSAAYTRGQALVYASGAWHVLSTYFTGGAADFAFQTFVVPGGPTPTPTRAPTPVPAVTPAPAAVTPTATVAATATPTPTAGVVAEASPTVTGSDYSAGSAAVTQSASPSGATTGAGAGSSSDPGGGSGVVLIAGLLVALLAAAAVAWFVVARRRQRQGS